MKIENVSLWVGNFRSKKIMDEYFKIRYTVEGDRIKSQFEEKFMIDYYNEHSYDDDYFEVNYFEKPQTIDILIEKSSYSEQIINKFMFGIKNASEYKGNVAFLVYNYIYNESNLFDNGQGYKIYYVGSVFYNANEGMEWLDEIINKNKS